MPASRNLAAALLTAALGMTMNANAASSANSAAKLSPDNPFARESTLPYKLPPLDKIKNEHFVPALEAGMAEQRKEVADIAGNKAAPTFENTIVTLERSGQLLGRAATVFFNLSSSHTNPVIEQAQTELAPKLSAHSDAIFLDPQLFARVKKLYEQRQSLNLDPASLRLLERYHTKFVRAGANLTEAQKTELRTLNEKISSLTTEFRQLVLKSDNASAIVIEDRAELDGFTDEQIAVAAEAAKSRGKEGKWVITMLNTTGQPALSQLKNRAVRERLFKASIGRGLSGELDTTKAVAEIVKLRADRAKLLGYPNHAAYVLEDETALTAEAVNGMLHQLAPTAVANAQKEAADMQQLIDAQAKAAGTPTFKLQAWDWDFYAEQVRAQKFSYDESQVRPYFEANRV
ncbi:MAG: M3 family metallopeptidase, partial [Steroidobacter sp.]